MSGTLFNSLLKDNFVKDIYKLLINLIIFTIVNLIVLLLICYFVTFHTILCLRRL